MEKFAIGLVVGGLGGALLVANNYKMRTLIKKGQAEVQAKLDKLMDDKMDEMDDAMEEIKSKVSSPSIWILAKAGMQIRSIPIGAR